MKFMPFVQYIVRPTLHYTMYEFPDTYALQYTQNATSHGMYFLDKLILNCSCHGLTQLFGVCCLRYRNSIHTHTRRVNFTSTHTEIERENERDIYKCTHHKQTCTQYTYVYLCLCSYGKVKPLFSLAFRFICNFMCTGTNERRGANVRPIAIFTTQRNCINPLVRTHNETLDNYTTTYLMRLTQNDKKYICEHCECVCVQESKRNNKRNAKY